MEIRREIQTRVTLHGTGLEEFEDRIIFMSMFNIARSKDGNYKECLSNPEIVRDFARTFPLGHGFFLGPGEEEKRYGTQNYKPEGQWNSTAEVMVSNL